MRDDRTESPPPPPLSPFVEALALDGSRYLEAGQGGFRLHSRAPWDDVPPGRFADPGEVAITRQVMAGACWAGLANAVAVDGRAPAPVRASLLQHVWGLAAAYRTTHATPRAMRRVAERMAARHDHAAARYCRAVAREEDGHDTLALNDIAALGLPAADFVAHLRSPVAVAVVRVLEACAESEEPLALLGYAYALERSSLFRSAEFVAEVERCLPAGVRATRCLRVHSVLGTEAAHLERSLAFIASRAPGERAAIARAAFSTASLLASDYPGDDAVRAILQTFDWTPERAHAQACCA